MSDNEAVSEFMELEEKKLMEAMMAKAKTRAHSSLGDSLIKREEDNKKAVANIFTKMSEGKIPEAPVTAPNVVVNRLDEDKPKVPSEPEPNPAPVLNETAGRFRGDKKIFPKIEEKKDDFNLNVKFEEKVEEARHDIPTESLTNPKVKDAVSKLRNMAAELRGESTQTINMEKPLIVRPADGQKSTLVESVEEPSYSLKKLNSMLYRAQDKFNQTDNPVYESIADELSSVIAEALLSNKKSVPKSKISKPARAF